MEQEKIKLILREITWKFSKSSGPGGQHVNTTDSTAKLEWRFMRSELLSSTQKNLLKKNLKSYLTKDLSRLKVSSSKHRSKERNKAECIKRLHHLLKEKAFFTPKKRLATKPTRSSVEKRIQSKKQRADVKKNRQKVY